MLGFLGAAEGVRRGEPSTGAGPTRLLEAKPSGPHACLSGVGCVTPCPPSPQAGPLHREHTHR